jgi:hypothetical protein
MNLYCSECGLRLTLFRKSMAPKYNIIIDVVVPHVCLDEPVMPDLKPDPLPIMSPTEPNGKFVQKLNDLKPRSLKPLDIEDPSIGDKRPSEYTRSELSTSAPKSVLEAIKDKELG